MSFMVKSISANFQGDAKSDDLGLILTSNNSGQAQIRKRLRSVVKRVRPISLIIQVNGNGFLTDG